MNGLLLIDKPAGITSMDVCRRARKALNTRKIGHTGTLDPAATGLLCVTVGSCTKLAKYLALEPKIYTFDIVFGELTETADDEGAVVATGRSEIDAVELEAVLGEFVGDIMQAPPRYSAVRVDGKRAYELARAGVDFELPARPIHIDALELVELGDGIAKMSVTCGTGTYVRSLAVDIAARLDTVAHARHIRRTRVGAWTLEQARCLDEIGEEQLMRPIDMVSSLPHVELNEEQTVLVRQGKPIPIFDFEGFVALVHEDTLIAIADSMPERGLQPRRVFMS